MRWADNYRTGRLGGPQLIDAQLRTTTTAGPGGERYGAGLLINGDGAFSHDGGWAGFTATFHVSADHRVAIAVSCNGADPQPTADLQTLTGGLQAEWAEA